MIRGKFILRADAQNKKGECQIYLQYITSRKIAKTPTGVWVKAEHWNSSKEQVVRHPNAKRINNLLQNKKWEIDEQLHSIGDDKINIDVLRKIVAGKNVSQISCDDFVAFAKEVAEQRYKSDKIGISVRDNAICTLNHFNKFLGKKIAITDISSDIIREYIIWRRDVRGNDSATINKALTPIIKACQVAKVKNYIKPEVVYEIEQMYLQTKDDIEGEDEVRYLTTEQLSQLSAYYHTAKYDRTRDYLDMFFFSFYCCGLRFSDILTLQWTEINMEKRELRKVCYKTRKTHRTRLTDNAIAILRHWRGRYNRFVFGLLSDDFNLNDEQELKRQRINRNTPIKTSLRHIGDKLGWNISLTMHVARHSFAVLALQQGIRLHVISQLLWHSSIIATEKTYAKFLPSTLDNEVDSINFNFT